MAGATRELTSEDYAYRLPDHWLLDEENTSSHFPMMYHAYSRRVAEIVRESGARTALEVGCGDGYNCGQLAEAGLEVVGIDWSRNGVDYASMLVPKGRFYCGDIRDEEFSAQFPTPFDAVILVEVLEHIPPDECVGALKNITAPLKSGGTFVLTTPSVNLPNNNPLHYRHFTEEILRSLIAMVGGLTIESIEGYGDIPEQRRMYRRLRWVDNRYYTIKPIRKKILRGFKDYCLQTPLSRCSGFIITMRKD